MVVLVIKYIGHSRDVKSNMIVLPVKIRRANPITRF